MFEINFLNKVLNTTPFGEINLVVNKFVVNSKKVSVGNCFIGLPGEKYHGSSFFQEALSKGANGLIIDLEFKNEVMALLNQYSFWVFFVKDSKKALWDIAYAWRKKLIHIPIIAITGSAGKTTTKEMIKQLFVSFNFNVLATENSENGLIGLPLTILNLRENHQVGIIEVGIQKKGEMDILVYILQSIHTLILTVFMLSHGEYFQTVENVIQEKMKLQSIVTNKVIMPHLAKAYYYVDIPSVVIDVLEDVDYKYNLLIDRIEIFDKKKNKKYVIKALLHDGIRNCIVNAFVCAVEYGLPLDESIIVLEKFKQLDGRFSIHNLKHGGVLVNDAYNAASISVMEKAIDAFISFPINKKKILILGDMLEQGKDEEANHKQVYCKVNNLKNNYEYVYLIGSHFGLYKNENKNTKIHFFQSINDIKEEIDKFLGADYCVFFKSSNSIKLFHYATDYLKRNEY